MRSFAVLALYGALAACATSTQDMSVVDAEKPMHVEILGCCSFLTSGNLQPGDGSVPVDGFLPKVIENETEKVTVSPHLGFYDWLDAQGGQRTVIGKHMGLSKYSSTGSIAVIALERAGNQGTPLSVHFATDCTSNCRLFDQVLETFEIERQWRAKDP